MDKTLEQLERAIPILLNAAEKAKESDNKDVFYKIVAALNTTMDAAALLDDRWAQDGRSSY